ncbi:hypothetical protein Tco_0575047, partial [Tanacetum coccineum]
KQIHANVDGKAVVLSESSMRRELYLNDEDVEFYLQLLLATSQPPKDPSTYRRTKKGRNTKVPQFGGSPNKVGDEAINEEMLDSVERAATTATSLEAEHASGNIYKTQFTATLNEQFSLELGSGSGPWRQETMGGMQAQTRSEGVSNLSSDPPLLGGHTLGSGEDSMEHQIELTDNVANTPYDSPLLGVNTPGSDKGRLKLEELMAKCKKLSKQVLDLEKEKDAQAVEIFKLKKRVESFDDDLDKEDASKQGRTSDKTKLMFKDKNQVKIGADDTEVVKGSGDTQAVNTASEGVSTASVPETKAKEKGVAIKDVEDSSKVAIVEMFDEVQARIDADYELAARMTQEEQEKYTIEERATLLAEFFERRKKQLAVERA